MCSCQSIGVRAYRRVLRRWFGCLTSGISPARSRSLALSAACHVGPPDDHGRIFHHTTMPKTKVALTIDADLLEQVDDLVAHQRFRNRSQAFEAALADKLHRVARTRLAREAAKLKPADEKLLAEEGVVDALDAWPEY